MSELRRDLTLYDAMNLVIGTIIGSGIFLVPAEIARAVHQPGWMLAVWVIGGVLTMLGALSLAELGAAMPDAGGIYSFITRGFGRLPGFLCGWMLFTVATSGSIATLGAAFPIYLGAFVPLNPTTTKVVGVLAIALLTWINIVGVKNGARVGNVLTALKVGGLVVMVVVIFLLPGPAPDATRAPRAAAADGARAARGGRRRARRRALGVRGLARRELRRRRDPRAAEELPAGAHRRRGDRDRAVPAGQPRVSQGAHAGRDRGLRPRRLDGDDARDRENGAASS